MSQVSAGGSLTRVEPNRHAPAAGLERVRGVLRVRGYQEFSVAAGSAGLPGLPVPSASDRKLQVKRALLGGYFNPAVMRHRTVLDVGGNAGFFSLWSLSCGAAGAVSIDVDDTYTRLCREVATAAGATNLRAETVNLRDWAEPADVVLAFAMVHWLYAATTGFGSLERVAAELAARTRGLLLIEWVAPTDSAIRFFGHLELNRGDQAGPYTRAVLVSALRREFAVVEEVGRVSETRELLACWKTARQRQLDLSWHAEPLAEYGGIGGLWSSKRLATDPSGVGIWSRVYDGGDRVVKQASPCLIRREAEALRRLMSGRGAGRFPRLLSVSEVRGVVELEKVAGVPIDGVKGEVGMRQEIRSDPVTARRVFVGLLRAVEALAEAGVVHRDLRPDNLLIRDGEPVVLDLGWAEVSGVETGGWVPASLGEGYRPSAGGFDDGYSAGKVMAHLLGGDGCGVGGDIGYLLRLARLMYREEPGQRLGWRDALRLLGERTTAE